MSERTDRYNWLDILKFFGIFLVAFGHIYTDEVVLQWLYTFHVPLFFIAGGIVYRPRSIAEDLKRRAYKILVPYAIFGVLILLYFCIIEYRFRDIDVGFIDGALGLLIADMDHLSFHSHLWFLPCYFITSVVYNILYKLLKPVGCGIVCAAATLAFVLFPIPSLPWGADRMCGYLGLFALGHLLAHKGLVEKVQSLHIAIKLISAAVLVGASAALSIFGLTEGVMWIVCAVIGTAGFAALSMSIDKARLLSAVGRMTLVALCIHGPIYRVLIKLVSMLLGTSTDAVRGNIFTVLAITAVTLAVCCIAYKLLEKLLPWSIGLTPKKTKKNAAE